jgi:hypothetical protein
MMDIRVKVHETHPSGAKAQVRFASFAARLKSCPFKAKRSFAASLALPAGRLALPLTSFAALSGAFPPQVSQAKTMKRGLYV